MIFDKYLDCFCIINKPIGETSNRTLSRFRRISGVKKCGYAGTLDPFASGVLVIGCNKATKLMSIVLDLEKVYEFTVQFGYETDSGDIDGVVIKSMSRIPSIDEVVNCINTNFIGQIIQIPPVYSAVKHHGNRLCDLMRKGSSYDEISEIAKQRSKIITISSFNLILFHCDENVGRYKFSVSCSKGTYIRQLVVDLAHSMGTVATAVQLERVRVGAFSVQNSIVVDDLEKSDLGQYLVHIDDLSKMVPA